MALRMAYERCCLISCSIPARGVRRALDTKTRCHVTNLTNGGRIEFATPRHTFSLCWETSVHGSHSPAVPPGGRPRTCTDCWCPQCFSGEPVAGDLAGASGDGRSRSQWDLRGRADGSCSNDPAGGHRILSQMCLRKSTLIILFPAASAPKYQFSALVVAKTCRR